MPTEKAVVAISALESVGDFLHFLVDSVWAFCKYIFKATVSQFNIDKICCILLSVITAVIVVAILECIFDAFFEESDDEKASCHESDLDDILWDVVWYCDRIRSTIRPASREIKCDS